tara:strand:- start:32 stop:280 length:249 start_codon:yes stop_codon:yes gene_type:complete
MGAWKFLHLINTSVNLLWRKPMPAETQQKDFWYKIEDSLYDEKEEEDFRRIRSHVKNEIEEEKKKKYKQLEFDFEEDLVAPI